MNPKMLGDGLIIFVIILILAAFFGPVGFLSVFVIGLFFLFLWIGSKMK